MNRNRIVILVEGGLVRGVSSDKSVDVLVLSHDGMDTDYAGEGDEYAPGWGKQDDLDPTRLIKEFNLAYIGNNKFTMAKITPSRDKKG